MTRQRTFGAMVRHIRGDISRAKLAQLTGLSERTLEHWETGNRTPKAYAQAGLLETIQTAVQTHGEIQ